MKYIIFFLGMAMGLIVYFPIIAYIIEKYKK